MTFDRWLKQTGLSPQQLAEALGVSLSRIYQIRTQATATPHLAWRLEQATGHRVPAELVRGGR